MYGMLKYDIRNVEEKEYLEISNFIKMTVWHVYELKLILSQNS